MRCSQCKIDIENFGIKVREFTFCDVHCLNVIFPTVSSLKQMLNLGFTWIAA